MVRLTMTATIVTAIGKAQDDDLDLSTTTEASEPSLHKPAIGNPISHGQIIALSKLLRQAGSELQNYGSNSAQASPYYSLDELLRGATLYKEPSKPKAEPVSLKDLPGIRLIIDFP